MMSLDRAVKNLEAALSLLREQKDNLEAEMGAIERLLSGSRVSRARGRSASAVPAVLRAARASAPRAAGRKKPFWSPKARAAARERMQRYWAKRKKARR